MRILLFCGNRSYSLKVLQEIANSGLEIIGCVSSLDNLNVREFCEHNHVNFYDSNELESNFVAISKIVTTSDFMFSYLYANIISSNFIDLFGINCINFHPSPLPEHRGVAGCCFSLLEEYTYWGVTAHQLIEKVDAGAIIEKIIFEIEPNSMFATDVEKITQIKLFELFQVVLNKIKTNSLSFEDQKIFNKLYTRKQLQEEKKFNSEDSLELINKKIKALWLPPYHGLSIEINKQSFTLINDDVLKEIHTLYLNQKE